MKDSDYIKRMPREKVEKILLYNEQDVVNLYHIYINWKQFVLEDEEEDENDDIKTIEEVEDNTEDVLKDEENEKENSEEKELSQ